MPFFKVIFLSSFSSLVIETKRWIYFLFFFSFFYGVSTTKAQTVFSLKQSIGYALEHSEEMSIAKLEKKIAKAEIQGILAAGLPQITGEANFQKNIDLQQSFIQDFITPQVYGVLINEDVLGTGTEVPTPQTFPVAFGTNFSGNASVHLKQLIFDGSFFIGLKAAREVNELRSKEEQRSEAQVIESVSKTFYLVLMSKENLTFLTQSLHSLDTLLQETEVMYHNGFVEKLDVSRLRIQYNNAKTSLENATKLLQNVTNLLKFQIGMPISTPLEVSGNLEDVIFDVQPMEDSTSYLNRPEYLVLESQKRLIEYDVSNFKFQYVPKLYAHYNLGWVAGTNTFDRLASFDNNWFRYSNLGLKFTTPIFDGFYKRSNIQKRKVQLEQVAQRIKQFQNSVQLEASNARISLLSALDEVNNQEQNYELAQEVFNTTKIKFQEGVGANIEVVDANTSLRESWYNYIKSLYDAVVSQIDLQRANGTLKYNQ